MITLVMCFHDWPFYNIMFPSGKKKCTHKKGDYREQLSSYWTIPATTSTTSNKNETNSSTSVRSKYHLLNPYHVPWTVMTTSHTAFHL